MFRNKLLRTKPMSKTGEDSIQGKTLTKSGRRGSNPRQRHWQRRALPTELRPQNKTNQNEIVLVRQRAKL